MNAFLILALVAAALGTMLFLIWLVDTSTQGAPANRDKKGDGGVIYFHSGGDSAGGDGGGGGGD